MAKNKPVEFENYVIDDKIARPVKNRVPNYEKLFADLVRSYFFDRGIDVKTDNKNISQNDFRGAFSHVFIICFREYKPNGISQYSLLLTHKYLLEYVASAFLILCNNINCIPNIFLFSILTGISQDGIYKYIQGNRGSEELSTSCISKLQSIITDGSSSLEGALLSAGAVGMLGVANNSASYNLQWTRKRTIDTIAAKKSVELLDTSEGFAGFLDKS